jgi:hypothetical protein
MNHLEAASAGYELSPGELDKSFSKQLCEDFSANHVFVTRGKKGYDVFSRSGDYQHFDAMNIPNVVSTLGAGDAFFAGIVSCGPRVDLMKCPATIRDYLLPVLTITEAAPEIQRSRKPSSISVATLQISIAAALLLIGLSLSAAGQFHEGLWSNSWAAAIFLCVPLFAGAAGGITAEILKQVKAKVEPIQFSTKEGFLGAVAGVLASILFGLPYLTLNAPDVSRVAILRNLMLYDFVFSIVAGLTFQSYLHRLISKTHLPDTLRITNQRSGKHGVSTQEG